MMGTHAKFDFNLPTDEKEVAAYGKTITFHLTKRANESKFSFLRYSIFLQITQYFSVGRKNLNTHELAIF